jgi:hypothetical protein
MDHQCSLSDELCEVWHRDAIALWDFLFATMAAQFLNENRDD